MLKGMWVALLAIGIGMGSLPLLAESPLVAAVQAGQIAKVKELIAAGGNVNEDPKTFEYAVEQGDLELVKVLHEAGVTMAYAGVVKAIRLDRFEIMTYLVTNPGRKLNLDQSGSGRVRAAYDQVYGVIAIQGRNAKILKLLLDNGSSPFWQKNLYHKDTPVTTISLFTEATKNNDLDSVRALFEAVKSQGLAPFKPEEFSALLDLLFFERVLPTGNPALIGLYFEQGVRVNQLYPEKASYPPRWAFDPAWALQTPLHVVARLAAKDKKAFGKAFDAVMAQKPSVTATNKAGLTAAQAVEALGAKEAPFGVEVAKAIASGGEVKLGVVTLPSVPAGRLSQKRMLRYDPVTRALKVREREGFETVSPELRKSLAAQGKTPKDVLAIDRTFTVLDETVILLDGKPGTVQDLLAGKLADVEFFTYGGGICAMKVKVGKAPETAPEKVAPKAAPKGSTSKKPKK